jgi:hypothetical protein
MGCLVALEAELLFAEYFSWLNAKYLKWMLAHLKKIEWLCCCQGPVAYALMAEKCRPPG